MMRFYFPSGLRLPVVLIIIIVLLAVIIIPMCLMQGEVTVVAVGDILLDRGVGRYLESEGYGYPFERVKEHLTGDIVVGNLEGPVSDRGYPLPKMHTFRFSPETLRAVKGAGFNVLNLANNHSLDYGRDALLDTMENIKNNRMLSVGAGIIQDKASAPVILEKRGTKVALLAFSVFPYEGLFFNGSLPGISLAGSPREVKDRVSEAAAGADIVIVSFHWGNEFTDYPSRAQTELAHAAVDGGADLVIGHHPHVLQGVERYRDGIILYSLGNFVFDQNAPRQRETVLARVVLDKNGVVSLNLVPLLITDCQPRIPAQRRGRQIGERLVRMSSYLGLEGLEIDEGGTLSKTLRR